MLCTIFSSLKTTSKFALCSFFVFHPLLTSVCSWRDQPLLGTLVVVTLKLPCGGGRSESGGRGGWEEREEEGMNQNTIKGTGWPFWELKAHWLEAARTDCGEEDTEERKKKANETFYFARKRAITLQPQLAAKQGVFNRDAQSEQNNFKMKGRRGLCNTWFIPECFGVEYRFQSTSIPSKRIYNSVISQFKYLPATVV